MWIVYFVNSIVKCGLVFPLATFIELQNWIESGLLLILTLLFFIGFCTGKITSLHRFVLTAFAAWWWCTIAIISVMFQSAAHNVQPQCEIEADMMTESVEIWKSHHYLLARSFFWFSVIWQIVRCCCVWGVRRKSAKMARVRQEGEKVNFELNNIHSQFMPTNLKLVDEMVKIS